MTELAGNDPAQAQEPRHSETDRLAGNPYVARLRALQVPVPLDVPSRFTPLDGDPLTGLPVEDDTYRTRIVHEVSRCLRTGKKFIAVFSDADNLKSANDKISHDFGDVLIAHGAAKVGEVIAGLDLPPRVSIFISRPPRGGADEVSAWLFDVPDELLEPTRIHIAEALGTKLDIAEPKFTFSSSSAVFSSQSAELAEILERGQEYLSRNPHALLYDTYNEIVNSSRNEIILQKIVKDLDRLPKAGIAAADRLMNVIKVLGEELGGTRISTDLLNITHAIVAARTYIAARDPAQQKEIIDFLASMGITIEDLVQITGKEPGLTKRIIQLIRLGWRKKAKSPQA